MPPRDRVGGWDCDGTVACPAKHLVLGCLSGVQSGARHVRRAVSAPAWVETPRDRFPNVPQAPRWHGAARPRPDRRHRRRTRRSRWGWVGGRTRGKGRGVHGKVLVSCAVGVRHRHRKPGAKPSKRRGGRYTGRARLAVSAGRSAKSLCGFVEKSVKPGTLIITDGWGGCNNLKNRGHKHLAAAERGDPQVAEEYLPIIHLMFPNLKAWLRGIHHGVSHQHLQAYPNEFTSRFNRRFYPFNAFRPLLGIAGDVVAPTYAEPYSGDWAHPSCCDRDGV